MASFNYHEFDLEDDLVGLRRTWYLSGESIITLLKIIGHDGNE